MVFHIRRIENIFVCLQQAELQEDMEARGERMGGLQTHKRMVASLEKQIAVQEKKLEQVSCF